MGKKRKGRKPAPKPKNIIPLDKVFNCLFCNNEACCEVKIDKTGKVGMITCGVCMESFQTRTHALTDPIDVYNDWIDACEEANPSSTEQVPSAH